MEFWAIQQRVNLKCLGVLNQEALNQDSTVDSLFVITSYSIPIDIFKSEWKTDSRDQKLVKLQHCSPGVLSCMF
jgi:hypothetical protein